MKENLYCTNTKLCLMRYEKFLSYKNYEYFEYFYVLSREDVTSRHCFDSEFNFNLY